MRCWAGWWVAAGVALLAACSGSAGGAAGGPSGSRSSGPSPSPSASATGSSAAGSCAAGHTEVTVVPGDAAERPLCVRPGAVVTLILRPRADDRRWTAVHSSAPVFVLVSGWQVGADGTARADLRCAATRAGAAEVTVLAKAPDLAGPAHTAFTLHVSVVPYAKEG